MSISAIICEFNPLHMGHKMIVEKANSVSDAVICVMSGNFVQRGEPAILDKWTRTKLALFCGADLVVELPLPWATGGAEKFSSGAIHIINSLGCVEKLIFGSENEDINSLKKCAEILLSEKFKTQVKSALGEVGIPFAKARENAICTLLGENFRKTMRSPNCILAIEYIKALIKEQSKIDPIAIKRSGADHDKMGTGNELRSAGEIRKMLLQNKNASEFLPACTVEEINNLTKLGYFPADFKKLELPILCKLRTMSLTDFSKLPDISEGIENNLYNAVQKAASLNEIYTLVKSKRYSHARIRRLILSAFLEIENTLPTIPSYIRILGMSKKGEKVLRNLQPALPLAVRYSDFKKLNQDSQRLFELEATADDIYALSLPTPFPCGEDFTRKLIKI